MVSVSNIVETATTKLENKIGDLENKVEFLASEVWSLQNANKSGKRQPSASEKKEECTNEKEGAFPGLPLRSVEIMDKFNQDLENDEYYTAAVQYFNTELKARTDSKVMYTRRLHLKKMMFLE